MAELIIPLRVNEEQFEKLREIGGWECTELEQTLHDMIETRYEQFCNDMIKSIEDAQRVEQDRWLYDDEIPF